MSLNYRLVRRPDMRKDAAEGSKLYYAQVRSLKKLKFEKFCNMVAVRSSAFVGDVKLVIDGILSVMEEMPLTLIRFLAMLIIKSGYLLITVC